MRKISDKDLQELHQIFEVSGGLRLYQTIDYFSRLKAIELGLTTPNGEADMDRYTQYLLNE